MTKGHHVNQASTDEELIALIQQGNREAFTIFYQRHRANMYLSAYHLLHDEDEANDAVQELFSTLWQHPYRIQASGNVKGYLYTVLRNRILTTMSRSKYLDRYIDSYLAFESTGICTTEDTVLVRELEQLLEEKISQLPPKMREVYTLAWNENLSNKEIAERMGISEGTVKQHKHHALHTLRIKLQRLVTFLFF